MSSFLGTYLTAPYRDREKVKALGARWDPAARQWYVPHGRDLSAFGPWLPVAQAVAPAETAAPLVAAAPAAPWSLDEVSAPTASSALATPASSGLSLSQLLGGVSQAVAAAYRQAVWVRLEVLRADLRRGHVYLEVVERDATGQTLAQAKAMLWADVAQRVVPEFERATGVVLGAGIKLLVRARPQFHTLYGLSLVVEALDPAFTLGDLEAKKREIRQRLIAEGLWEANRQLPAPWDFNAVLVVAPQAAAGLGDFQAEAQRLAALGLCEFVYAFSRFQGEGAADEIRSALLAALARRQSQTTRPPFDAVVLIRGGGAVNDLAWLNDYELARCLCQLPLPVLTGIGHERDSTVLDEVAHQAFDTPSKVVAGIQQRIAQRAAQAREFFQQVQSLAFERLKQARQTAEAQRVLINQRARQHILQARREHQAAWAQVQQSAQRELGRARQDLPLTLARVQQAARSQLQQARLGGAQNWSAVWQPAQAALRQVREKAQALAKEMPTLAHRSLALARERSQALVREIAGQGPEKTLQRGFAIVRHAANGQPVTMANQLQAGQAVSLEFHDGSRTAFIQSLERQNLEPPTRESAQPASATIQKT